MKIFSIKWKLSLAFVAVTLLMVGIYVFIAKETFESDKISYVFDSQQKSTDFLSQEIRQKVDEALFLARTILGAYDAESDSLSPLGNGIFENQKVILGLEIRNAANHSLLKLEKQSGLMPAPPADETLPEDGQLIFREQAGENFLILGRLKAASNLYRLRLLMNLAEFFHGLPKSQVVMLTRADHVLYTSDSKVIRDPATLTSFLNQWRDNQSEKTTFARLGQEEYLLSVRPLPGDLQLISMVPRSVALGALQILYRKSVVFMIFSLLGTIVVSFLLAATLTLNLKKLSLAAEKIGQGDFSFQPDVKSRDEMGLLSRAFQKMTQEISRLLIETKDKGRMEAELKTASLVQESLLPASPSFMKNQISLSGVFATSTECGGDWWYYYERGDDLYVVIADATGHGTPSALITAAARSLFSKLEKNEMSLFDIAKDWDEAIAACSRQKVFMTALLLKINTKTGEGRLLNASHEPPIYLRKEESSFSADYVLLEKGPTLGEMHQQNWVEQDIFLEPGSKLLMYTDGIWAVENAESKTLSEKRVLKAICKIAWVRLTADSFISDVFAIFEDHRQDQPMPDDVTMVAIQRADGG